MTDEEGDFRPVSNPGATIGFLAICATVGIVAWIVSTSGWTEKGWIALGAIGALLQAIVVALAAAIAVAQLRASERLRRDQFRPYVVAKLEPEADGHLVHLVVENIGATPAKNVSFSIDPPLESSLSYWKEPKFLKDGIQFLAPGQRYQTIFEDAAERSKAIAGGRQLETSFAVTAAYQSTDGTSLPPETAILEVDASDGSFFRSRKSMHHLVAEVKRLNEQVGKVVSPRGVAVVPNTSQREVDLEAEVEELGASDLRGD